MFKPFSDNLIFFDTEFSSLDPMRGELLSIGMVKMNDEELYFELDHQGEVDDWQKENILPSLTEEKVSQEEATKMINEFVGEAKPYVISYVHQFDMPFFYKLIPQDKSPFHWLPIDFASVLFAIGIDPEIMARGRKELYKKLELDYTKYQSHHALDDARLLKETYLKLLNNPSISPRLRSGQALRTGKIIN